MNYTENYQLPQWEESDRVLREDFNAAMTKLEDALTLQFYVEIVRFVSEQDTEQIDLDVSSISFLQFHKIELYVSCPSAENGFLLRVNHIEGDYSYTETSGGGGGSARYVDYLASFPAKSQGILSFYPPAYDSKIGCVYMYSTGGGYTGNQILAPCTWEELRTINLISTRQFPANTCVRLLGLKK